jgi:predicted nucleotidyltransferase
MSKLLDQLISEFQSREERGLRKYGTSMDRTDLSFDEWLQHFKEELLDGLCYLQKIQNIIEENGSKVK